MILSIAYDDYSNLMFNHTTALQAAGVDAQCVKMKAHPFGYSEEAEVRWKHETIRSMAEKSDKIIIYHSALNCLNLIKDLGNELYVFHTGTTYRQTHEFQNSIFNPIVKKTFTDTPEFMKLGAKDIHYITCAIDTEKIKPIKRNNNKLVIGHFPSNAEVKGTDKIVAMMQNLSHLDIDFRYSKAVLPHNENLKRMAECDIYIELFAPNQNDKEYGSFGVTAFEAAAMECIVITQNLNFEVYENAYFKNPFYLANTEEQFDGLMNTFSKYLPNIIKAIQEGERATIIQQHSFKAIGNQLKNLLYAD